MLLSVIFSFRNEEKNLNELIKRTSVTLQDLEIKPDYELIFVNDQSTDGSLELLLQARSKDPRIKIINMSRRFGVSECVLAGLNYAKGDAAIYLDADLQDPPELIAELVRVWLNTKADVVYTTRTSREGEGWLKLFITKIGYKILNKLSEINIPQDSGDFKLISRRVIEHLKKFDEKQPFLRGLVRYVGFRQEQVFYTRKARFSGKSQFPVLGSKVIYNFLDSALISFSIIPLKLALFIGALSLIGGFFFFIWIFIQKIIGWAIPGWSAIMATIVFFFGIVIFLIGVLGLYIGAIFREVKRRPNFIVSDTVGFDSN